MQGLVFLSFLLPVLGDNGVVVDVQRTCTQAFDIGSFHLDEICATFSLNSCAQSIFVEVTYGGNEVIRANITNLPKQQLCRDVTDSSLGSCQSCLTFNDLTILPSYAKVCPDITVMCTVGPIKLPSESTALPCLELGDGCSYRDCDTCTRGGSCGWCRSTNNCMASGRDGPYCAFCNSDQWVTGVCDTGELHVKQENAGVIVPVAVTSVCVVLLSLLIFFLWARRQRKQRTHSSLPQDDVEDARGSESGIDLSPHGTGNNQSNEDCSSTAFKPLTSTRPSVTAKLLSSEQQQAALSSDKDHRPHTPPSPPSSVIVAFATSSIPISSPSIGSTVENHNTPSPSSTAIN